MKGRINKNTSKPKDIEILQEIYLIGNHQKKRMGWEEDNTQITWRNYLKILKVRIIIGNHQRNMGWGGEETTRGDWKTKEKDKAFTLV